MKIQSPSISCVLLFVFTLAATQLSGQSTGKISGKITDSRTPLEFVTVTAAPLSDSTQVLKYFVTDSLGFFTLEGLPFDTYKLECRLIGYEVVARNVTLTKAQPQVILPEIDFSPGANELEGVTVTAQRKLIERTTGGFIVNTAGNLVQAGGTATDLLKNTPAVTVDADGAITLRGKSPLILVNGRNSSLGNPDNIPASSIESIEILTNPSAKYDANAESGIINIRLKKNKDNGINGAFALAGGVGAKGRISSSAVLNQKTKKWSSSLGYDNRFAGRTRDILSQRTNFFLTDQHVLDQIRHDYRTEELQNLKLNLDFTPNEKNNFAFEAIGNIEGQINNEDLNSTLYKTNNIFNSAADRFSLEKEKEKVGEMSFNYKRNFADDRKSLSGSFTSSHEKNRQNTDINTQDYDISHLNLGDPFLERTHNYEHGATHTLQLDYALPVHKNLILETGYKGLFRSLNADFETANLENGNYIIQTGSSNIFNFNEEVQAAYAIVNSETSSGSLSHWSYSAGLRAEQVTNTGETQDQNTNFKNDYLKLFPNASLSYAFSKDQSFRLSYSKRIRRPGSGQLNPFVDITDALNPHSGNANLKPEIIHALEMGYTTNGDKHSFSTNLFYRSALNTIRPYYQLLPNGVSLQLPVNIGSAITFGSENIYDAQFSSKYNMNLSLSFFQQIIHGTNVAEGSDRDAFGWNGKMIHNLVPWQNGKLQLIGNYISNMLTPQGQRSAQYFVDLGFQQKILHSKARLGLTVVDVFNTLKSGVENFTTEFSNYRNFKADTRAVMLTLAYSFRSTLKEKLLENKFSKE